MADKWSKKKRIAISQELQDRLGRHKKASEPYEAAVERLLEEVEENSGSSKGFRGDVDLDGGGLSTVKKTASRIGNGAHICVPKDWAGRPVLAVLQSEEEGDEKNV